ncbi:MAG: hypothetical protein ACFFFB_07855 [Candidatus Heimdallarchaeota archaeon]
MLLKTICFALDSIQISQDLDWGFDWITNILSIMFVFFKYILSFILIILGVLVLFRFKKNYAKYGLNTYQNSMDEKVVVRFSHVILGTFYIIFGIGILSTLLTYFLIWVLDPIPDRYIFIYINSLGLFNPWSTNSVVEISSLTSVEHLIFYAIALGSFLSLLEILVSIWLIVSYNKFYIKAAIINLIVGFFLGILTGFTTCLPLLL